MTVSVLLDPARVDRLRETMRVRLECAEPAHDFAHVLRVTALAERIARAEGADLGPRANGARDRRRLSGRYQ